MARRTAPRLLGPCRYGLTARQSREIIRVVDSRAIARDTAVMQGIQIDWFVVATDSKSIRLSVTPPHRPAWQAVIPWESITRVCFAAEDPLVSDGLYLFTNLRPDSWVVPVEAVGGTLLLDELARRRLFDPALATKALTAVSGLFCWPDERPGGGAW